MCRRELEAAKLCVTLPCLFEKSTLTCFLYIDPVFFASQCGATYRPVSFSATALSAEDAADLRLLSLHAAVDFAKTNNLLGLFLDAGLLVRSVPSLVLFACPGPNGVNDRPRYLH